MNSNNNRELPKVNALLRNKPVSITNSHPGLAKGLSAVLDPVGDALGKGLRPIGAGVETLTKPVTGAVGGATRPVLGKVAGERDEKMEVLGGDNKDSYEHGKSTLGGHLQTGDNPLGLDQTGKFGFRDEK